MFAKYQYVAGASVANILADVVAILTGTTNKAMLSADCDQANTYILSTVAAGWTVFDASAGTNKQCISAPCAGGGPDKYVVLDFNTSGYVLSKLYETWNASTHTGTNVANLSDNASYSPTINATTGGILFLAATNRYLIVQGYISGIWSANGPAIIVERERIDPWDTSAAGYPCGLFGSLSTAIDQYTTASTNNGFHSPRCKGATSDVTGANACYDALTAIGMGSNAYNYASPVYMARDASFNSVHALLPIYLRAHGSYLGSMLHLGGKIQGDIYLTTRANGSGGDEITYNSSTFFIFKDGNSGNIRLAIPKY